MALTLDAATFDQLGAINTGQRQFAPGYIVVFDRRMTAIQMVYAGAVRDGDIWQAPYVDADGWESTGIYIRCINEVGSLTIVLAPEGIEEVQEEQ